MDMMKEDPAMIRMCAHPVMMSVRAAACADRTGRRLLCRALAGELTRGQRMQVMREYFGRHDMGYGHTPIVNTMKPVEQAPELTPGPGWHSDFPYNGNMFDANINFGIQCNICFDEFREDNGEPRVCCTESRPQSDRRPVAPLLMCALAGATYFHLTEDGKSSGWVLNHPPHAEMNERFGKEPAADGIAGWLPEGSQQMCAPAGSVIMYDSKTWHRAPPERNVSGADRIAILNAVTPRYIVPMIDMAKDLENAVQASKAGEWEKYLTARERREMDAMLSRNNGVQASAKL